MTSPGPIARHSAAPRASRILAELLGVGVLAQAVFAGGFLGGRHRWLSWHQHLGDLLVVVPIVSLVVGLVARHRQHETASVFATRILVVALVAGTEAAGHAGGSLLALHIPLAAATMAITGWQVTVTADRASGGYAAPSRRDPTWRA